MQRTMDIWVLNDHGVEREIEVEAVWKICPDCRGEGKSSRYLGAFTSLEFDAFDDDVQDDYLSGRLDRTCDRCKGWGKLLCPDVDKMLPRVKAGWEQWLEQELLAASVQAAERRAGA